MFGSEVIGLGIQFYLNHRGFTMRRQGTPTNILLPKEHIARYYPEFCRLFKKSRFRKVCREILLNSGQITVEQLEPIATSKAGEYTEFLKQLGVIREIDGALVVIRDIDNIGPTLEWFISDICRDKMDADSAWSVRIVGAPQYDYDVLAGFSTTGVLMYIEAKSGGVTSVDQSHLKHFADQTIHLNPDLAILLIDSESDVASTGMLPYLYQALRVAEREKLDLERHYLDFAAVEGCKGVYTSYKNVYVTNTLPGIEKQLRCCLQHFLRDRDRRTWE